MHKSACLLSVLLLFSTNAISNDNRDRDINVGLNLQQQGVMELRAAGLVVLGNKAEIVELVLDANELYHSRNSYEARSLAR